MKLTALIFSLCLIFFNTVAQGVGERVTFKGTDGKTYTGTIGAIYNGQYKINYDGVKFEAWLSPNQFTVLKNGNVPNANNAVTTKSTWVAGDRVEVYDMYTGKWENAIVTTAYQDRNPKEWRIKLDDNISATLREFPVPAEKIRPRNASANAPSYTVNERVDAYYADGQPHGRAIVIANAGNGKYKIRYEGCDREEVLDWSQLKPASELSASNADVTAVFGKWAMFVYGYPTTVIKGNDVYREYSMGAKAPPLLINANGTYVWYDEYNKPPVKGKWYTDSYVPGMHMGTESVNGIILLDSHGTYWKVHKDNPNHIEARTLCSGMTQGGTLIR
jgi:hypothetical protein